MRDREFRQVELNLERAVSKLKKTEDSKRLPRLESLPRFPTSIRSFFPCYYSLYK
jgi:hypothetical protein